jgi:hypothetical protein
MWLGLVWLALLTAMVATGSARADLVLHWSLEMDMPLGVTGPEGGYPTTDYNQDTYPDLKVNDTTSGFTLVSGLNGTEMWSFTDTGWAWVGHGNTDFDSGLEIVLMKFGFDTTSMRPFGAIRVLDAATGVTEDELDGSFGMPGLVDVDGDGMLEFVMTEGINTLACYKYDVGTSVAGDPGAHERPAGFELRQNYPNPFNPNTTIAYSLDQNANVRILVYNSLGRLVRILVNEHQVAGVYEVTWNGVGSHGNPQPSGVYFYQLHIGSQRATQKMVFLK